MLYTCHIIISALYVSILGIVVFHGLQLLFLILHNLSATFFESVKNQQISEELRYKMLCYTLSVILLPAVGPSP